MPALEPIGTVRIVHISATEKKIGRLCILKPYRNYKFGMDLMLAAHDYLCKPSVGGEEAPRLSVSLHAQIYVKGFYAKCVSLHFCRLRLSFETGVDMKKWYVHCMLHNRWLNMF